MRPFKREKTLHTSKLNSLCDRDLDGLDGLDGLEDDVTGFRQAVSRSASALLAKSDLARLCFNS